MAGLLREAVAVAAGSRKRPTDKQRWVLEQLEEGGHIEAGEGRPRVLVNSVGNHRLQDSTYWALQEYGWLWMAMPGVWRITTAGRAVLAKGGKR